MTDDNPTPITQDELERKLNNGESLKDVVVGNASFPNQEFDKTLDFSGAIVQGRINFNSCKFKREAKVDFTGAQFAGKAETNFFLAQFSDEAQADFSKAHFLDKARANFFHARFSGKSRVDFSKA